jgi:hypothetical protein
MALTTSFSLSTPQMFQEVSVFLFFNTISITHLPPLASGKGRAALTPIYTTVSHYKTGKIGTLSKMKGSMTP